MSDSKATKKEKLLIVVPHLNIGGAQKSLISALKVLDYGKYDVTVYSRKNRTALLSYIDERARVIINKDSNKYYRKPYAVVLQIGVAICSMFGAKAKKERLEKRLSNKIHEYSMMYEKKMYFGSEHYDKAIAFVHGHAAWFVSKCINADKKYIFFHTSSNDYHEMHEEIMDDFYRIIALHDEQKELISSWYPGTENKIRIVENYADIETVSKQSKEITVQKPADKTVLCSCGRLVSVKGFDLAVEAAKILKKRELPFVWYFVGDGSERENIEKLIEKYGLNGDIVLAGMQKNPYPYMSACDIYIQPSYGESVGITILEAQRLYKPIVSTRTVGGQKLIDNGENGILCDIEAEAIADAIENLIKNSELSEKINQNLKAVDYSGEKEKYSEQWRALLEE